MSDDPHPRNRLWFFWGIPLFNIYDLDRIMFELNVCCDVNFRKYVKVIAYDHTRGVESIKMSFIVHRPHYPEGYEPGFRLSRTEFSNRKQYTLSSYAVSLNSLHQRY